MNLLTLLIIILIIFLFFFGSFYFLFRYLRINRWNARGRGAEKKTRRTLRNYAMSRNFKVLSDLTFVHQGEPLYVESVLVGFFGVLLVHTCGARGEYYGKVDEEEWVFVLDDKKNPDHRETIDNPLHLQNLAIQSLRKVFANERIYNVDLDRCVVVSNSSKKTAVFVTQEDLIFTPKEFKQYLRRVKFDKDNNVDVEQVVKAIEEYSQSNQDLAKKT